MLKIVSKRVLNASWNIRFTSDLDKDIDELSELVVNFYLNRKTSPDVFPWKVTNSYSQEPESVNLVIFPQSTSSDEIAVFNPANKTLSIYPNNLKTEVKDRHLLFNAFKNAIQHEAVHIIDPKMKHPRDVPSSPSQYYSSPIEFDAYSKQIIEDLRNQISDNPDVKQVILDWLRRSVSSGPLSAYSDIFNYWEQSDLTNSTDYIHRFKSRVYNELFSQRRS